MKIDCILSACTSDEYTRFIPVFIDQWGKILPNVDVKVVLISEELPAHLQKYKDQIILFSPIPEVHSGFVSQYIRLLYPALLSYENGVLITDINLLPLQSKYFVDNIASFSNDHFISYRDNLFSSAKLCMDYNIATPKVWSEVFYIETLKDVQDHLIQIFKQIKYEGIVEGSGWHKDQELSIAYILMWYEKNNKYVYLTDSTTGFKRLYHKVLPENPLEFTDIKLLN